jgi:hypothetical protein
MDIKLITGDKNKHFYFTCTPGICVFIGNSIPGMLWFVNF